MKAIAAAFVKAQKSFEEAIKSSTNPFFKSSYAGLPECIDAVLPHLHANGIAVMQPTHECADGVIVETLFIHESGETLSAGKLHVPASKNDPQAYGSALSYARRYSLSSACFIKTADDDGNAATSQSPPAQQSQQSQGDDKPWFNDFNKQKDTMKVWITRDGQTAQQIIDKLLEKYKVNNKVKDDIRALEAAP